MVALVSLALAASGSLAHRGPGPGSHEIPTTVGARLEELRQAMATSNFAKFRSWMLTNTTPDFSYRAADGSLSSRDGMISNEKMSLLTLESVKAYTFKLSNMSVRPDHTSVTVRCHADLTTKDHRRIVENSVSVDTWRLTDGRLKLASSVTTKDRVVVNGKTVSSYGISPGESFP